MLKLLRAIALRPFNGDTRRGPRREFILRELERAGCDPKVDRYGNVWVVKGSGDPVVLFSAHLDVDPRIKKIHFRAFKKGQRTICRGILDNAAGCYLNLELARKGPNEGTAVYVFTASEEVDRINPRLFVRSAKEVVRELKRTGMRPKLCVAIDVTYPRLRMRPDHIDWSKDYEEIFDASDRMHCYLDGFSKRVSRETGKRMLERYGNGKVGLRRFHGHDEAFIYDRVAPSFAFGPVVFGHFDRPDQHMPLPHLKTALNFLKKL